MSATVDVIEWGHESARVGPWRGRDGIAELAPVPGRPGGLSSAFIRRCVDELTARGFREVLTPALPADDRERFLAVGFEVREELYLLSRPLEDLPEPSASEASLRRGHRGDRPNALVVDHAAFPPFWQLDETSLRDALAATPAARFRVAVDPAVVGYAISGRAARRGYLQRLAVDPAHQGLGLGRALVLDGMRWMRRWGAHDAIVNTQLGNDRALALYGALGFELQEGRLAVLHRDLP